MKKLMGWIVGLFGLCMVMASTGHASGYAIAPMDTFVTPYSTVVSTYVAGPGAVYEVILASGAASEYVQLFDSAAVTGLSATYNGASVLNSSGIVSTVALGPRLLYGSTTANTIIRFDPPLQFFNGLAVVDSAVTGQASITYQVGRGLDGTGK